MGQPKLLMSWSSGKDSAWALHVLRSRGEYEVVGLFTTFNAAFDRVATHGVRRELTEAQARATCLPLHWIALPHPCSNAEYERITGEFVAAARADGVSQIAFGDLFLADIRAYREKQLASSGVTPVFREPSRSLAGFAGLTLSLCAHAAKPTLSATPGRDVGDCRGPSLQR